MNTTAFSRVISLHERKISREEFDSNIAGNSCSYEISLLLKRAYTKCCTLVKSKILGFFIFGGNFGRAKEILRLIYLSFALKIGQMTLIS